MVNAKINKRKLGEEYERKCLEFLRANHIHILESNFRNRTGEIDIIGRDDACLIFFEVKYRRNAKIGLAENAVGIKKQNIICRVSDYYRMIKGYGDETQVRYDVLAINGSQITWYKNAFDYI